MSLVPHILYFGEEPIVAEGKQLVVHQGQVAWVRHTSHQVCICEFQAVHLPKQLRMI